MSRAAYLTLALTGLAALLLAGIWSSSSPVPLPVRVVGAVTVFTALSPTLRYLTSGPSTRRPIPFLPLVGLIYAIYFGVPFAFGAPRHAGGGLTVDLGFNLMTPALLALLGWLVLLVVYWEVGRIVRPKPWDASRFADPLLFRRAGLAFLALGITIHVALLFISVPAMLGGLIGVLRTLGQVGAAFLVAGWSRGWLGRAEKLAALAGIVVVSGFLIGTGAVAAPGRFWVMLLFAGWIGSGRRIRKRWILLGAGVVLVMLVLRGAAGEYRERAWFGADLGPIERIQTYAAVVVDRTRARGISGVLEQSAETVGERTSQAAVLADVVRRTPESVPYWDGDTYYSLVGAFVPRFLWPSKPTKNLGQRFGHRYSYLDPQDTWTSFNFPFLVEFYANFGPLGILFGMAVVGTIYRVLDDLLNRPERSPSLVGSMLALGLLVPLMTNIESDFSLVFGGLLLNGAAMYVVLRVLTSSRSGRGERSQATAAGHVLGDGAR